MQLCPVKRRMDKDCSILLHNVLWSSSSCLSFEGCTDSVLMCISLCMFSWNWAVSCPCYQGIQRNHRKLKCPPFSSLCSSSFASPRSTAVQVLLRVWRICWLLARQGPQYFPRKQWRAHCADFIWPFRHFQTLWAIRRAFLCSLPSQEWQCGGVPVTSLCVIERRKGKARVIETLSWFVLICPDLCCKREQSWFDSVSDPKTVCLPVHGCSRTGQACHPESLGGNDRRSVRFLIFFGFDAWGVESRDHVRSQPFQFYKKIRNNLRILDMWPGTAQRLVGGAEWYWWKTREVTVTRAY